MQMKQCGTNSYGVSRKINLVEETAFFPVARDIQQMTYINTTALSSIMNSSPGNKHNPIGLDDAD
jgi:hypothetical protein